MIGIVEGIAGGGVNRNRAAVGGGVRFLAGVQRLRSKFVGSVRQGNASIEGQSECSIFQTGNDSSNPVGRTTLNNISKTDRNVFKSKGYLILFSCDTIGHVSFKCRVTRMQVCMGLLKIRRSIAASLQFARALAVTLQC